MGRLSSWLKNRTQFFLLKRHQFIKGVGVENQSLCDKKKKLGKSLPEKINPACIHCSKALKAFYSSKEEMLPAESH
jgi:hypothetical protein